MSAFSQVRRTAESSFVASAIALTLFLGGCAHPGGGDSKMSATKEAAQTHMDYRDAWMRRDVQGIIGTMHPDATFASPNVGNQFAGYLQDLFRAVPDFTVERSVGGMIDPDTLAKEWIVTGTWTQPWTSGPLAGVPPTGKKFVLPGSNFIDFKSGKISSVVQYFDNMSLLHQIGLIQGKQ